MAVHQRWSSMDWVCEPQITQREASVIELQRRFEYVTRAIGVNVTNRALYRVMLLFGGEWSISALSNSTGISRSAVRAAMQKGVNAGLISEANGGFLITEKGQSIVLRVHRESVEITTGRQIGFTNELICALRDIGMPGLKSEARKIQFSKLSIL